MAGTREGGKKAAETTKERHGENFYQKIGGKGGEHSQGRTRSPSNKQHKNEKSQDDTSEDDR